MSDYESMSNGELCKEVLKRQVDSYHFDGDDFIVKVIDDSICCIFHSVNGSACGLAYSFSFSWGFVGKLIQENKIALAFMHGTNQWRAISHHLIRVQHDCPLRSAIVCYLKASDWMARND